ncbi:MAG: YbaN family protein [Caldisericia bacterium]|nr:YbaN family protein [Caldisericia bacterium]
MKKALMFALGILLVGIGSVGAVLPILPTVPFLLIACVCFSKSSDSKWFEQTKIYKKYLLPYLTKKGMTLKSKLTILIPVNILLAISFIIYNNLVIRIIIVVVVVIKLYVFVKMPTLKKAFSVNYKQETS